MVSFIISSHFKVSQNPILSMNSPCTFPMFVVVNLPKREQNPMKLKREQLKEVKQKNQFLLGFSGCFGVVTMCKRWESEVDSELELKVLEFMKNSKNPGMFPSKNELVNAGRVDLVEGILKRGGWMSIGWENDDDVDNEVIIGNGVVQSFDNEVINDGYESGERGLSKELHEGSNDVQADDSSSTVSSSGQSLDLEIKDLTGIEGILHRLEAQRNLCFGIGLGKNRNIKHGYIERTDGSSKDADSCHPEGSVPVSLGHDGPMYSGNESVRSYSNASSSSGKIDTWRSWSIQRAGYSNKEFEAAEIDFVGSPDNKISYDSVGETVAVPRLPTMIHGGLGMTQDLESLVREISQTDLKRRLEDLELELSSALRSLSSKTMVLSERAEELSSEDLRQLSDASEFRETEIMHTQNKLRSMRAKLGVLEGKMSLAIMDAQKILKEKQKRIGDARVALQLLRTTCIVWPNSGSEVLIAGSFDGWATQRKMERSNSGVFTLFLKLYPGQYEVRGNFTFAACYWPIAFTSYSNGPEQTGLQVLNCKLQIKFIVDGAWMVDPLRPIVNHSGFDNNLLIIS